MGCWLVWWLGGGGGGGEGGNCFPVIVIWLFLLKFLMSKVTVCLTAVKHTMSDASSL